MNQELTEILEHHFALEKGDRSVDADSAYLEFLQKKLAHRIEYLINADLEKLLQILYRIDVPQKYSDEAFNLGEIKKVSMKLAELIIRRQLEKIEYARNFKGDL